MSARHHHIINVTKAGWAIRTAFVLFLTLCQTGLRAQSNIQYSDTLSEVNVKGRKTGAYLLKSPVGTNLVDLRMMDNMPHILGNADPMHYAQLLPGVQTNSEYDAGLHVQGCDNAHNVVTIDGVPLYNVAHMLGFFSVFNTPHFETMQFVKSPNSASMSNRLGGYVGMQTTDSISPVVSGSLSVGPISSQGTLKLPLGNKSQLTISARQAYLNLLYGKWMKIDDQEVAYNFGDYNLTWLWQPNNRNSYTLNFYYGNDHMNYGDNMYSLDTDMKWGNTMVALRGKHQTDIGVVDQTLYYTRYRNDFSLSQSALRVNVPSSISDIGYKVHWIGRHLSGGVELVHHIIQPQDPKVSGQYKIDYLPQPKQHANEASLYADYTISTGRMKTVMGIRGNYYQQNGFHRWSADPTLSVSYDAGRTGAFSLQTSLKHQYLHRIGFSDMGLPTEFWFSADKDFPEQYAWNVSLGYETWLCGRMFHITLEAYYKLLYHQQEFSGNVFDILYSSYDLHNMLIHGRGRNYGINLLVEKRKGKITGWVSYSFGRAKRKFDNAPFAGWYPANHERLHELNAVGTYQLSKRWSAGITYVVASGTPFTAPKTFYMMDENIISVFGEHNAERLHPYMRLDVSVNYDFFNRNGKRSGLNLSFYNITMHGNDLFYRLKIYDEQFAAKPFRFVLPIMPSINYYYHF
jgi:hypothetical protein